MLLRRNAIANIGKLVGIRRRAAMLFQSCHQIIRRRSDMHRQDIASFFHVAGTTRIDQGAMLTIAAAATGLDRKSVV